MITREGGHLAMRSEPAPKEAERLEREGFTPLRAVFSKGELRELREATSRVFEEIPGDVRNDHLPPEAREDFRYEMLNRSAACQRVVADRRILNVVEPLLGEDCHVISNTAWRNPPRPCSTDGGSPWHVDAGPHVPLPEGATWDERIPHPAFVVAVHLMLEDCTRDCGPPAFLPGSHLSGRMPPRSRIEDVNLTWKGRAPVVLTARAGDVLLFVSDVWHRRMPTGAGDRGRFFLQINYGRRDIAQRLRPTDRVNQLSAQALARARGERERTVVGLHRPLFYDG